ncbi:MAG: YeeE/YedE family protein [Gammaproteobacteria bacterium]|nr:YeeE/YedE family protein [Gammaproteobacteria bacterium]
MEITTYMLLIAFGIAFVMGAVVNKTNFCTMGAVSDWVNMGDKNRFRAWMLAIAVALIGVLILEGTGLASVDSTLPPYRAQGFAWLRFIVGGMLFGIGMTLASGCGNKTLIRIGGGNVKSVFVLIIAGMFAYFMSKTAFYEVLFHPWVVATTIDLGSYNVSAQDLGSLTAAITGEEVGISRSFIGAIFATLLVVIIFKSAEFRKQHENIISGLVVGGAVAAAWYFTGGSMGDEWKETAEFLDEIPIGVATQSFTFINPMGETFFYAMSPTNTLLISFGMAALAGVIAGSFVYAVISRSFRIEWFSSVGDALQHLIGATLMGIGGVLAMGCTIGQGITGVSTLSIGSMLALVSIVFGSALTMKIQYYKMLHEDEATFIKALISSLVDLKLLPSKLRSLENL